jgi:hypothetical protein
MTVHINTLNADKDILDKPVAPPRLVKIFPAFNGTRKFITVYTTAHYPHHTRGMDAAGNGVLIPWSSTPQEGHCAD